jgi:hypothetical protein
VGIIFVREWVVPRFAEEIEGDRRVGYGIEVYIWAPLVDVSPDGPPVPRRESPISRIPEWVAIGDVPELPIWPVELKVLARAIASGNPLLLAPSIIGRVGPPTAPSPLVEFGLQVSP